MKLKTDMDFVKFYANKYKKDRRLFKSQKDLIESQLKSSRSFFLRFFGTKNFKKKARKFLMEKEKLAKIMNKKIYSKK